MYNAQWSAAQKVIKKWDGRFSGLPIKIFTLYNAEAHLDWQPKTWDERAERAKWHGQLCSLVKHQKQFETVLIDNPDNKVNIAYGKNPNGITIIDPQGKIVYYRDWFRYGEVDKFLGQLFKDKKKKVSQ